MAHTIENKEKLLHRVRRLRGQLNAVEKALDEEKGCSTVLLTLAACRGAMDALMGEIIEGHIRFHVLDAKHEPTTGQKEAAEELITVIHRYLM
jgi:DNA-binding FrmR family transcriptional regulator